MYWVIFCELKPDIAKRVVYFRYMREKFGIGKLEILKDDQGSEYESWVTEYSNCHTPHPKDRWTYLPDLKIEKEIV